MITLIKILILIVTTLLFSSCSLFLGGVVYVDNSINKGENDITLDELNEIDEGKKIAFELTDSTKIIGYYKSISKFDQGEKLDTTITILSMNNTVQSINTSDINKYYYVDEGGNVWLAFSIGAVFDLIMFGIMSTNNAGLSGPMFMGPL